MIAHEHDPDVVRWGLHNLIDVYALSTSGSYSSVTRYDTDTSSQEELSRVAAAESSGLNIPEQESIVKQNWPGPSERCNGSEHENNQQAGGDHSKNKGKDSDEISIATSSSSFADKSQSTAELSHSLDIADESALDNEVGKRLNEMVSVPHVPKINGELPSEDEEISDHQRLLDRLKVYDLVENKMKGDGNCQFRSISDQLYRSSEHHKYVRELVVNQLRSHPEMYEGYVPMAFADYLNQMSKSGEWGDHVTLQAAADVYGVKIFVITSFKDTCYMEILPHTQKSKRIIFLSFWAEVHYNSIYPEGETLPENKKKKWWKI